MFEGNRRFELQQSQLYGDTTDVKYRTRMPINRRLNYYELLRLYGNQAITQLQTRLYRQYTNVVISQRYLLRIIKKYFFTYLKQRVSTNFGFSPRVNFWLFYATNVHQGRVLLSFLTLGCVNIRWHYNKFYFRIIIAVFTLRAVAKGCGLGGGGGVEGRIAE